MLLLSFSDSVAAAGGNENAIGKFKGPDFRHDSICLDQQIENRLV